MNNSSGNGIRLVLIKGSVRPDNYTAKAAALVEDEIRVRGDVHLDVIDPAALNLPLPGLDPDAPDPELLRRIVSKATGVILATPEYHGGYSSVIKLVIENLGFPSVLAGKPIALLGVAAGAIGAIKSLENLRGVCSHVGAIVLPGPVSVANVQGVFEPNGACLDEAVEKRVRSVATILLDFINDNVCPRIALESMVRSDS